MAFLARDVAVVFGLAAGAYAANNWCAPAPNVGSSAAWLRPLPAWQPQ